MNLISFGIMVIVWSHVNNLLLKTLSNITITSFIQGMRDYTHPLISITHPNWPFIPGEIHTIDTIDTKDEVTTKESNGIIDTRHLQMCISATPSHITAKSIWIDLGTLRNIGSQSTCIHLHPILT